MEIINILLIGKDLDYCKALSESIAELSKEIMITLCEQNNVALLNSENYSLLLVEGNTEFENLQGNIQENIQGNLQGNPISVFLVDSKKEEIIDLENKIFNLYKYENVKELIRTLFIIYNALTGKSVTIIGDNNCKLVTVFSGCGGSGKTSISLGLAQEFIRFRGKKTLYINYEEWDGTWKYMDFQSEEKYDSIGNYLYYLKKDGEVDLKAFLKEDAYGVSYFKPSLGRNQLKGLCTDDLCHFTNRLIEANQFEYIIFDCQTCLDDSTLWLLKNSCGIVYLAEKFQNLNTGSFTKKDIGIIEFIESKFNNSIKEKLIKVYNKFETMDFQIKVDAKVDAKVYAKVDAKVDTKVDTKKKNEVDLVIAMDPGSFQVQKGMVRINIERGFGEGIKSIADRIEND